MDKTQDLTLKSGHAVVIDAVDAPRCLPVRWHLNPDGYVTGSPVKGGRAVLLHRWLIDAQPGQIIHHVNGDPLDNRRANLVITDRRSHCRDYHNGPKRASKRIQTGTTRTIRIDDTLAAALEVLARRHHRSVQQEISWALFRYVADHPEGPPPEAEVLATRREARRNTE